MDNVVCFHNPNEQNGYLSNWYLSNFEHNGIQFTSMEQYMMYSKAALFNDTKIMQKILATQDVAEIKRLGREVRNFSEQIWDCSKEAIITSGLYAKFSQNVALKQKLIATEGSILAECAVKDKIWGIGLSMTDPARLNVHMWLGQNLLGKCLMIVRSQLISQG